MKSWNGTIHLAVVGSKGSGKSALTVRFLTKRFIGEYDSQADVCIKRRLQIAGRTTDINFKDTAGCDWLKGPSALIGWSTSLAIVYSIADARSFDLAKFILQKLNVAKRLDAGCVLLIGNKSDLEHLREVSEDEGRLLAMNYGIHFKETSASRDYEGVDTAFRRLLFETLAAQASKVNISSESLDTVIRKTSAVVRDNPARRSIRRTSVSQRTSTGSFESFRDSMSSYSDDDHINIILRPSPPLTSPLASPESSPHTATRRRKISIPSLFSRHQNSMKQNSHVKLR